LADENVNTSPMVEINSDQSPYRLTAKYFDMIAAKANPYKNRIAGKSTDSDR